MNRKIEHIPIELGVGHFDNPPGRLRLSYECDWGEDGDTDRLVADFGLGDSFAEILRIEINGPVIVRVADETWVSTATDSSRWVGNLNAFAREVRGDDFAAMHELFFILHDEAKHYQFVTLTACLDVLASTTPRFSLVRTGKM